MNDGRNNGMKDDIGMIIIWREQVKCTNSYQHISAKALLLHPLRTEAAESHVPQRLKRRLDTALLP